MTQFDSMESYKLRAPVLLLVFNRPSVTKRVLDEIRKARPARFYVAGDGPRKNMEGDEEKVEQVRNLIQQEIDWDCEVSTLYRERNLGCRQAVSEAIDWFFSQEEEGIILEDDCLPHKSFFHFCDELLKKYRDDSRILMISGNSYQSGHKRTNYSYYFSRYAHVWGWATWRRAWRLYDVNILVWPELREGEWLKDILPGDEYAIPFWERRFDGVTSLEIDTWDHQWMLNIWAQHGLVITPNINLVSNIGFGHEATHTKWAGHHRANIPIEPMTFPLDHPPFMIRDTKADGITERRTFKHRPLKRLQRTFDPLSKRVIVFKQILTRS